jgi:hypothetical protein
VGVARDAWRGVLAEGRLLPRPSVRRAPQLTQRGTAILPPFYTVIGRHWLSWLMDLHGNLDVKLPKTGAENSKRTLGGRVAS